MPAPFDDPDARIGGHHWTIGGDRCRTDAHKMPEIVIEGIELGDFSRSETVYVGQGQARRRIEARSRRLYGEDETRLLAEVGTIGTLSVWTTVTLIAPLREPLGKMTLPGAILSAKPGRSESVRVPP